MCRIVGMAQLKVIYYPEKVLLKKAEKVRSVKEIGKKLINDMTETMFARDGVGLAATQINLSKQIAIICPSTKRGEEQILVNPEIIESSGEEIAQEGCLSLPGISAEVKRATKIKFRAMDLKGTTYTEMAEGFPARVIQHEIDHLNGILIIDRVDFDRKQELLKDYPQL